MATDNRTSIIIGGG